MSTMVNKGLIFRDELGYSYTEEQVRFLCANGFKGKFTVTMEVEEKVSEEEYERRRAEAARPGACAVDTTNKIKQMMNEEYGITKKRESSVRPGPDSIYGEDDPRL